MYRIPLPSLGALNAIEERVIVKLPIMGNAGSTDFGARLHLNEDTVYEINFMPDETMTSAPAAKICYLISLNTRHPCIHISAHVKHVLFIFVQLIYFYNE